MHAWPVISEDVALPQEEEGTSWLDVWAEGCWHFPHAFASAVGTGGASWIPRQRGAWGVTGGGHGAETQYLRESGAEMRPAASTPPVPEMCSFSKGIYKDCLPG